MEFRNKKILLMCKETFSIPFYFLLARWMKNNDVAVYFFNPSEVKYNCNSANNSYTYYAYKKNYPGLKIYTSLDISDKFSSILYNNTIIDPEYLEVIERKYTHFKNLNSQIISTQILTSHYHYRKYYPQCTYTQQLNWLILNYKKTVEVLDDFQPDMVLDCDNAELARCVMCEICYKRNIPYIFMDCSRYEDYRVLSYSLGRTVPAVLEEKYRSYFEGVDSAVAEEITYVKDFRAKSTIMHEIYKNDVTSQYKPDSIYKTIRYLLSVVKMMYKQDIVAKNYSLKKTNPLLYPTNWKFLKCFVHQAYLKQLLLRKNNYFVSPVEDEKYVYMPLHLIPESSTFSLAPLYINELSIIEAVSKSLPAGWYLYVKEHQAMVGERYTEFYKKVNSIPNVKMVQLNYYQDPKPWITKSQGVVTISGTTAYEAALLGKPAIVFSDVCFSVIEGITRVKSYEDLASIISKFTTPINNVKSCAAYIASVKDLGCPIDLKKVINEGAQCITHNRKPSDKFLRELDNIDLFFQKGYEFYSYEQKRR